MRRSTWGLADVLDRPRHWTELAACRRHDPDLWWPIGHSDSSGAMRQAKRAAAICDTCPVQRACHADALNLAAEGKPLAGAIVAALWWPERGQGMFLPLTAAAVMRAASVRSDIEALIRAKEALNV